jgi:hypothetical protein
VISLWDFHSFESKLARRRDLGRLHPRGRKPDGVTPRRTAAQGGCMGGGEPIAAVLVWGDFPRSGDTSARSIRGALQRPGCADDGGADNGIVAMDGGGMRWEPAGWCCRLGEGGSPGHFHFGGLSLSNRSIFPSMRVSRSCTERLRALAHSADAGSAAKSSAQINTRIKSTSARIILAIL